MDKTMDKTEILERCRAEKIDEGMQQAEDRGRKIGQRAFYVVSIFIIIFNLFTENDNSAPQAMFWAFVAAEAYPKYQFTKKKDDLLTCIAGAITSTAFLLTYILNTLR